MSKEGIRSDEELVLKTGACNSVQGSNPWPSYIIKEAVENSLSCADVCRYLGLKPGGASYRKVRRAILTQKLSTSHFDPYYKSRLNKWNKIPTKDILVENSTYHSSKLKKRLIKEGLKEESCEVCGQLPTWNGSKLTLQIDHINGISDDHRLENLRIICPNCHTQTDTYTARNKRSKKASGSKDSIKD